MTIVKTADGPFLEMHNVDGEGTVKYVSVAELFGRIWDNYIRRELPDEFTRSMLSEMGLTQTEAFSMMDRLQMGRAEYERNDYKDMAYIKENTMSYIVAIEIAIGFGIGGIAIAIAIHHEMKKAQKIWGGKRR